MPQPLTPTDERGIQSLWVLRGDQEFSTQRVPMCWCSPPSNAHHCLLQDFSGLSIPAVLCPPKKALSQKGMSPPLPPPRSHHTEASAHLGPPYTPPACHSTLREQRKGGRRVPCTSQEVWAGQPISTGCISQHGRVARVGVTAWLLQPLLHLLQPGLQAVSLRAGQGDTGDSEALQGCHRHLL